MDEETKNRLIKKYDELCADANIKVVHDIYDFENKHYNKVSVDYGRFISQFELYYSLVADLIHAVNYIDKKNWPAHRSTQFLIAVHNLKTIFSAFNRLIKGYYGDSLILIRPVYEAIIKMIYITCYPDFPYDVAAGKKMGGDKQFNLTNFIKDELKLNWHDYSMFSAVSHANWIYVLRDGAKYSKEKQTEPIALSYKYDKDFLTVPLNFINFLLLAYLKFTVTLFATSYNNILKKELIDKANELIALREETYLEHPKEYWPQVIKDFNDIFEMIQMVENDGKDWKEGWKLIRSQPSKEK